MPGWEPKQVSATLYFDGACIGNRGTAGIGFVLRDGNGRVMKRFSRLLGYNLTTNVAKHKALIAGLQHARDMDITDIVAYGDSELDYDCVNGQYRVRDHDRVTRCCDTVLKLQRRFQTCRVMHVPRQQNQDAHGLASRGIVDDHVDESTDEILRRCGGRRGARKYVLDKRCEGFSQISFILDTIRDKFPYSYRGVRRRCRKIQEQIGKEEDIVCMPCLLVEY